MRGEHAAQTLKEKSWTEGFDVVAAQGVENLLEGCRESMQNFRVFVVVCCFACLSAAKVIGEVDVFEQAEGASKTDRAKESESRVNKRTQLLLPHFSSPSLNHQHFSLPFSFVLGLVKTFNPKS